MRRTPAAIPASGSSSSTGASEPFATTAPLSRSVRNAYVPSSRSPQNLSARSRSDGAWLNCTEQATPISREARQIGRIDALGVLDPLAQAERRPELAGRRERVERLAVRAIADRMDGHGPAGRGGRARTISASSSPLVMHTPLPSSIQAVCEPSVPSMNAFR